MGVEPNLGGPPFALLARETAAGLVYAGSAFVTLPQPERDRFWTETEKLKTSRPSLSEVRSSKASFVKPELRVRAKHMRSEGMLRHARLNALLF